MLWVPGFFALRVLVALGLLKLSASYLPVGGFAELSQLMLFTTLLNILALCGAQNGVIRQAAAAANARELAQTQNAAFTIWLAVAPLLLLGVLLGHDLVSDILVGSSAARTVIVGIALTVVAAAPGGIWCALLTGRRHVAQSLFAQALGLLAGGAAAAWRIMAGDPPGAALAFAGGSLVTAAVAGCFSRRLELPFIPRRGSWEPVRMLLRFSGAIAAAMGCASAIALGLRWIYRERFGDTELGYWLTAVRVSDMSTQLVGLLLVQLFVPHLAARHEEGRRRAFLVRCWGAAAAVMVGFLAVFCLASRPLIHVFLSDAYLPAAPVIRTYMIGDVFRVWPSLAMYTAFANGRPIRYAGIELGALTAMATVTAALTAAGDAAAPQTGYVVAYGLAAMIVTIAFLARPGPGMAQGELSSS